MIRSRSRCLLTFAVVLSLSTSAAAVERTTDAERSHRAIRDSIDAATQLLAERWIGLVRLQEWTDATGRFKTRAKYVEHDPGLAWVKLRVIQGSGAERVVKDVQVPVEKLSPLCKSRVRQIAFLSEKVAAAVTKEQEAESAEAEPGVAGGAGESPESLGRGDEPIGGPPRRDAEFELRARAEREQFERDPRGGGREAATVENQGAVRGAPARPPMPAPTRGQPLPAMLPPVPGSAGLVRIGAAPSDGDSRVPAGRPVDTSEEPAAAESRE